MEDEIKTKKTRKKKDEVAAESNKIQLRDENGLLIGVDYIKDSTGFINWRAMINEDQVVLNREKYGKEGIDLYALSSDELEKIKSEAPESKKLIKIGGFKELVRLRGVLSQKFTLVHRNPELASVSCKIKFIPNYENPDGLTVDVLASASLENTIGEYSKYLEAIASNRAFTRAVKEAFGILTLGEEEICIPDDVKISVAKPGSPLHLLQKVCSTYGLKIEDLKQIFQEQVENNADPSGWLESWINFENLPTSVIATLVPKIKKTYKNKE